MSVLMIAAHDGRCLDPASHRAMRAAAALDDTVDILVAGEAVAAIATEAACLAGATRVLIAEDAALAHHGPEALAATIQELAPAYRAVLAPARAPLNAALPRAAAMLDWPQISNATAVLSPHRFARFIHSGSLIETVDIDRGPFFLTINAPAFAPCASQSPAPIVSIAATPCSVKAQYLSEEAQATDRPTLETARIVIGGGRGLGGPPGVALLERLADLMGASIGATRAACDDSLLPHTCQIGQNGHKIAPDLYLAVGIAGAIQHASGFRDAKLVAAINRDPEAPIFRIADIGLIGDLFQILPALIAALQSSER